MTDVIKSIIDNEYEHNKQMIEILIKMNDYMTILNKRIEKLEKNNAK